MMHFGAIFLSPKGTIRLLRHIGEVNLIKPVSRHSVRCSVGQYRPEVLSGKPIWGSTSQRLIRCVIPRLSVWLYFGCLLPFLCFFPLWHPPTHSSSFWKTLPWQPFHHLHHAEQAFAVWAHWITAFELQSLCLFFFFSSAAHHANALVGEKKPHNPTVQWSCSANVRCSACRWLLS